jgi:hypothetical protein
VSGLVLVPRIRTMGRRRRRARYLARYPDPTNREITMAMSLLAISVDGSDIVGSRGSGPSAGRPVNPGAIARHAAIDTASGLRLMFHQVPDGS